MRLATYNVEWFDKLFAEEGGLLNDTAPSGRHGVARAEQITAVAAVLAAVDADVFVIVEAPNDRSGRSTRAALEEFAAEAGLRQRRAMIGFANHTSQEIALLYDPDRLTPRHAPEDCADAPRFDTELLLDLNVDDVADRVVWSKPPLEAVLTLPGGAEFRLIGVHAKSKAPHGAKTPEEVMRISIANRRKQLAQCIWLRRRVVAHLAAGDPLIVAGDFNDGPGLDEYEKLFGRSGVEIVLGEAGAHRLFDPHAAQALQARFAMPTTSRFWLAREGRYLQALIDYVMVSPDLRACGPRWRIWHPFDDPECFANEALRSALLTASDHFPVSLDITL
ncbi:MAG: endonuclease/exonuclease/phosphatase family protein [Pseudomonadota bacterium]